jgi:ribosomal protein S18 acetylase RimI-like enzyme
MALRGLGLQVSELEESSIPALDSYLRNDLLANVYTIYDLQYERGSKAKFYVAKELEKIAGVLLKYQGYPHAIAIVLGSSEAIYSLLENVTIERMLLLGTPELTKTLEEKFPNAPKYGVNIMALDTHTANLITTAHVRRLGAEDANAWAQSEAHRLGQSQTPAKEAVLEAQSLLAKNTAFGIYDAGLLVARATSHVQLPEAWAIGGIFTEPNYRERGLAMSVTSALVQEALRYTGKVVLFVRSNNAPANHIYEKIGFRMIAKRTWLAIGTGITP